MGGCYRVWQAGGHAENFLFFQQETSWGGPPFLTPLCLLHHWEVSEVTSQHLLPLLLRWALVPDSPHHPAEGCTGMDHDKWGRGLGCWLSICQGMPSTVWGKSSGWVGSLCPPALQFWRGGGHPYHGVEHFSPQSHGTMAGFKEEYHLFGRVIDGTMCLVNISAMHIPAKSFNVKLHYKQEGEKRKVSFPSMKRIELF